MSIGLYIRTRVLSGGSTPSYDSDAEAYLNAISIPNDSTSYYSAPYVMTGAEIWTAVNNWFVSQKASGNYSNITAAYLYHGGLATTTKVNAVNPLDTDAAFRIDWGGGTTHAGNGVTGSVNGYGETHLDPSSDIDPDVNFAFFQSQTNTNAGHADFGAYLFSGGSYKRYLCYARTSGNLDLSIQTVTYASNRWTKASSTSEGRFLCKRIDASNMEVIRDGTSEGVQAKSVEGNCTTPISVMARATGAGHDSYSTRAYGMHIFGTGTLSDQAQFLTDNDTFLTASHRL